MLLCSLDCPALTDMSVFELACLTKLKRLNLAGVSQLTDMAIYSLVESPAAPQIERLHVSYCPLISIDSIHVLVRKLPKLQRLAVSGIPAFLKPSFQQLSDPAPAVRFSPAELVSLIRLMDMVYYRHRLTATSRKWNTACFQKWQSCFVSWTMRRHDIRTKRWKTFTLYSTKTIEWISTEPRTTRTSPKVHQVVTSLINMVLGIPYPERRWSSERGDRPC